MPTASAAAELRRTLERAGPGDQLARGSVELLTREDWYARMHASLADPPPLLLDVLQREVIMAAAARDAMDEGAEPPFKLRAGLVLEMLAFHDELRRRDQTVTRFEELLVEKLEPSVDDRGAAQMLRQTRFLAAAFRAYARRAAGAGAADEHALRDRLLTDAGQRPLRRLIVTVGDRSCAPPGLWIADFDLMARMPGVEEIDVIATERMLSTGWHERLHAAMPGIEEVEVDAPGTDGPALCAPPKDADRLYFVARDREEELALIARRLKAERRRDRRAEGEGEGALDRHAIVFKRPLPYLYLARTVFGASGIPYQAADAVPLAGEPYAAAIDVAIQAVTSGFTRGALVALLRSPHFLLGDEAQRVPPASARAFDRRLSEAGYLGDLDALARIAGETPAANAARPAARAALRAAERLGPLALDEDARASTHLQHFREFLLGCERPIDPADPVAERHLRARRALLDAIAALETAHRAHDDPVIPFADVAARLRRWIEAQTFRPRTGCSGIHLVDGDAAAYGTYDAVHVVGLIERDWPEPASGNVFYSPRLLSVLGWPAESDRAAAPRAAFTDLLTLPSRSISLSTVTLEDEALVDVSPFLDDLAASGLRVTHETEEPSRVFIDDALAFEPLRVDVLTGAAAEWLELRMRRTELEAARFQGKAARHAPAEISVSAVERYLECPFKYFAVHVLRLDEDPEDEDVMSPRARGLFIHQVFQAFFEAWGPRGAIGPERLEEARALFADVAERLLETLDPAEAALERTRLLGSPVARGLGDAVFRMEAERPAPVIERLLEFPVRGELEIDPGGEDAGEHDGERPRVRVRGVADRIDLLGDHTLRILDYKSGRAPQPRRALQLPLYSACAVRQLTARDATPWRVGEAAYIAFGGPRTVVPMTSRGSDDQAMIDAQGRLAAAVAGMRRGDFFVQPLEPFRCSFCAYAGVCRKDYVGDE